MFGQKKRHPIRRSVFVHGWKKRHELINAAKLKLKYFSAATLLWSVHFTKVKRVTPIVSSSVDNKSGLSNTAGLKQRDNFLFLSPPSTRSTVADLYGHSTLPPPVSPNFFPPTVGEGMLVWVQFLIHIGSGRWILPSCSPSRLHLEVTLLFQVIRSPHGYRKWMNMLWAKARRILLFTDIILTSLFLPHLLKCAEKVSSSPRWSLLASCLETD